MLKKKVYILKTTDIKRVAEMSLKILNDVVETEQLGKTVLLKPNAVGPYAPSCGVTTSPQVIEAMCQSLLLAGYEIKVGDCPGESSGTADDIFIKTGIKVASGDSFISLGAEALVVDFPCRKSGSVAIAKAALESDVVISLAKLKTSCFMMMSAAVKNYYGIIPGTQKAKIHDEFPKRDDFADMLLDLVSIPKRTMTIIDGSTLMEGNGPVHGTIRIENIYIISEDIFAADYAVAKLLGLSINEVPTLKRAQERGCFTPDNVEIISDVEIPLNNVQLPVTLNSYLNESTATADAQVEQIASIKIVIDQNKCICCGHCANVCPAQAIQMNPYPEIDHEKCIRCFCCNELCPVGAANPEENIKKMWDSVMGKEGKGN